MAKHLPLGCGEICACTGLSSSKVLARSPSHAGYRPRSALGCKTSGPAVHTFKAVPPARKTFNPHRVRPGSVQRDSIGNAPARDSAPARRFVYRSTADRILHDMSNYRLNRDREILTAFWPWLWFVASRQTPRCSEARPNCRPTSNLRSRRSPLFDYPTMRAER